MIPLAINGLGPVGAFGAGIADFKAAMSGKVQIKPEFTRIETRNGTYDLPVFRADSKPLANFIKPRKLRRLDNFSRLALLGAILATEDAKMDLAGSRTGLIVASAHGATATTFAFLDSVINDGDALASPTLFSNSVHNAAASHIAEYFTITGPTLSLTQGADSLTMALLSASQWLASGRVDTVLCGAIDCYCDVLGYCWQSFQEKTNSNAPKMASGPGEGTLFLHLTRAQRNTPQSKQGYLNQIKLNHKAPPGNIPFICTDAYCTNRSSSSRKANTKPTPPKNQIEINLPKLCGDLPIPASFDLAAASTIMNDKPLSELYKLHKIDHDPSFANTIICCWQPQSINRQKSLTGNCYWITNHADLNLRKQS